MQAVHPVMNVKLKTSLPILRFMWWHCFRENFLCENYEYFIC